MQNRFLLATILCLVATCYITGQTITSFVFPVTGDELKYYTALNPDLSTLDQNGSDITWNLSNMSGGGEFDLNYPDPSTGQHYGNFPTANLLEKNSLNQETYYRVSADEMSILGQNLDFELISAFGDIGKLAKPMVYLKTPLVFLNQESDQSSMAINIPIEFIPDSILNQLPIQPDSLRLNFVIESSYLCNGSGNLMLPGKSFEVLKVVTNTVLTPAIEAKVPVLGWLNVSAFIPVEGLTTPINMKTVTFWSEDQKGFVARFLTTDSDQIPDQFLYTANGTILGINKINDFNFNIFPNPVSDYLKIESDELKIKSVSILNNLGQEIKRTNFSEMRQCNVSELQPGSYFVRLILEDGRIGDKAFIKH